MTRVQPLDTKTKAQIKQEIMRDQESRQQRLDTMLTKLSQFTVTSDKTYEQFAVFEKELNSLLQQVGLAASEQFLSKQREVPEENKVSDSSGQEYKYIKEKSYPLRSLFGKGTYMSSQYRRGQNYKPQRELALIDSKVGLLPCGGLSLNLALESVELATRMPYNHATTLLKRYFGYAPSTRALSGLIDFFGPLTGEVEMKEIDLCAEVVIVQLDGRGLPIIREEEHEKRCKPHQKRPRNSNGRKRRRRNAPTVRRKRGEKAKKKKQVTVGVIYGLVRAEDGGWLEPKYKKYLASWGNAESVVKKLRTLCDQINGVKQIIFLSDGAPHYNTLRQKYFSDATGVIDFYHVCEYVWQAGEAALGEKSPELRGFVSEIKGLLLEGEALNAVLKLKEVQSKIPSRGPGTKGRRKRLKDAITYIMKRLHLMPYKKLREEGLEIGTGVIESAMRQVVAIRFEGPGMRWGKQRPHHLLNLLCLRLSGQWDELQKEAVKVSTQRRPRTRMTPKGVNEGKARKSPQDKAESVAAS